MQRWTKDSIARDKTVVTQVVDEDNPQKTHRKTPQTLT